MIIDYFCQSLNPPIFVKLHTEQYENRFTEICVLIVFSCFLQQKLFSNRTRDNLTKWCIMGNYLFNFALSIHDVCFTKFNLDKNLVLTTKFGIFAMQYGHQMNIVFVYAVVYTKKVFVLSMNYLHYHKFMSFVNFIIFVCEYLFQFIFLQCPFRIANQFQFSWEW